VRLCAPVHFKITLPGTRKKILHFSLRIVINCNDFLRRGFLCQALLDCGDKNAFYTTEVQPKEENALAAIHAGLKALKTLS
jgi:hypothetical protein